MAIEVHEQLQTLSYARNRWIPKSDSGKSVNPSTVVRWFRDGLEGLDGNRIRLEVTYRGQTPCTSREALQRFFAAVTAARLSRISRTQQRATDVTAEELESAGIGPQTAARRRSSPKRGAKQ